MTVYRLNGRGSSLIKVNKGFMRLRYKGHAGNALAPDAEERRSQLRKAAGRSKHPVIRGYLNGVTRWEQSHRL